VWQYIEERVRAHAEYILETGVTVRACAAHFHTSKSTVHKDLTDRLKEYDPALYASVRAVLDKNLRERHIRGGIATRKKYQKIREAHSSFAAPDQNTD
jgi:putative DeoR family transcriptional regulator (stage III sporulation protein D)